MGKHIVIKFLAKSLSPISVEKPLSEADSPVSQTPSFTLTGRVYSQERLGEWLTQNQSAPNTHNAIPHHRQKENHVPLIHRYYQTI